MSDDGVSDQIDEYARVRLDYHPSSGQLGGHEKNDDPRAPKTHDGSAKTQTMFHPEGHSSIDYRKLALINDGVFSDGHEKRRRHIAIVEDTKFLANKLHLSEQAKHTAVRLVKSIEDGQKFSDLDSAIIAALTLGCNKYDRWLQREDEYKELRDNFNVTESNIRKSRNIFRDRL